MAQINILDESTINKIAAGEVVERPVSVVKELVENAIDSGAENISIEIKGGGIDYIRVTDNGSGIEHDSIPRAFLRHATSKIKSIEDLMNVYSLGFRGEALSSIAAVSEVELMTKTADSLLGYRYCIRGGREMSFDEAGVADGTTVIVRNLFFNTPARRKFLKSAVTEGSYITELVERLILSHPEISFKYTVNGSLKLSSNGLNDIMSDVYSVFGRETMNLLVDVSYTSENCSISGYIGKPETARGNRNYELFFVNKRLVKSKVLFSAVEEAYKPFLMLHKFPFVILYIDIPSELLDVNVHPSKTEIRFMEERHIYTAILDTVTEGVTRRELIPSAVLPPNNSVGISQKPEINKQPEEPELPSSIVEESRIPEPFETKSIDSFRQKTLKDYEEHKQELKPVQETLFSEGFLAEENNPKHRIIGQVFGTYWIIEFEDKMYIIDQHAAHEKVLYERFSKQIESGEVVSQMISPPYIVTLTASEENILKENIGIFEELGFRVEHFGGHEYALTSVPAELFRLSEQDYFLSVIDDLSENLRTREPKQVKDRIATMACKAAIKGNTNISYAEADALISELLSLDNPYNCPHGRPTIISFTNSDLDKMFKRIV
ncbi:MAG: DNA mismatch repair endonuclease MutL [Lachnospiraceae bacterium]|nr:DNA mismatch repair endonuclease MutL [Lachnospiraceae bacterium]